MLSASSVCLQPSIVFCNSRGLTRKIKCLACALTAIFAVGSFYIYAFGHFNNNFFRTQKVEVFYESPIFLCDKQLRENFIWPNNSYMSTISGSSKEKLQQIALKIEGYINEWSSHMNYRGDRCQFFHELLEKTDQDYCHKLNSDLLIFPDCDQSSNDVLELISVESDIRKIMRDCDNFC